MKFHLQTFGCKTNQYESQMLREALLRGGEQVSYREAEVVIVNTCTVTGRADATWRQFLARVQRENPAARILLTGCAVNVGDGVIPLGVEKVFRDKNALITYLLSANNETTKIADVTAAHNSGASASIQGFHAHTRAFIKIQDGCDNACAYCIIPRARGAARSRRVAEILAEAQQLTQNGYRELVLTGINIGAYHDNADLATLCRRLIDVGGVTRLRLGSLEPPAVNENLLATFRDYPQICPHLHLPLQTGADELLKLMRRQYTIRDYFTLLEKVRRLGANPAITTDLIVGLPTENAAHFAETKKNLIRAGFAKTHLFLFSPRAGTLAATLPRNHAALTDERRRELAALAENIAANYAQTLIGTREKMLSEKITATEISGYGERYLRITLPRTAAMRTSANNAVTPAAKSSQKKNQIIPVYIHSATADTLIAAEDE